MDSWIICLEEVLPDFGINLDREKIIELAKIMEGNSGCISDMEYEMCGGRSSAPEIDYKALYRKTLDELESYKKENATFRESAARRNHTYAENVKIEDDRVMIYK
jgi:hypothetical protein